MNILNNPHRSAVRSGRQVRAGGRALRVRDGLGYVSMDGRGERRHTSVLRVAYLCVCASTIRIAPPLITFKYDFHPPEGSEEARLVAILKKPKEWV